MSEKGCLWMPLESLPTLTSQAATLTEERWSTPSPTRAAAPSRAAQDHPSEGSPRKLDPEFFGPQLTPLTAAYLCLPILSAPSIWTVLACPFWIPIKRSYERCATRSRTPLGFFPKDLQDLTGTLQDPSQERTSHEKPGVDQTKGPGWDLGQLGPGDTC